MSDPAKPQSPVAVIQRAVSLHPGIGYPATEQQRRLKARFWLAHKANPLVDASEVTPALVEQMTGQSVASWGPQFWAWFNVSDTVKEHLEVAAEKAAELALMYLDPAQPMNDNARVNLIKYILEFSGRAPAQRREVKWHDEEIQEMTPDQLTAYIAKRASKKLPKPPT